MDDASQRAWLRLANTPKLKLSDKRALIDHCGSAVALYATPYAQLRQQMSTDSTLAERLVIKHLGAAIEDAILDKQLELLTQHEMRIIPWRDKCYPALLSHTANPPLMLFVQGDADLLSGPQIAIVGARSASPSGLKTATQFARQLARAGISITSGLAHGIDGAAHQGALNEIGKTIAVVASGLDQVYPREHLSLAQAIRQNGAVVSEFLPGAPPKREFFPRRNRIISGLSLGVLIVEAGVRSGSLITARLAGEQGREVYAIPGSIHLPTSRGCHQLIRQGAKLVETTKDILEELKNSADLFSMLPAQDELKPTNLPIKLNSDSQAVLNLLDFVPTAIDDINRRSELRIETLSTILLELELMGLIAATAGGQYQRLP